MSLAKLVDTPCLIGQYLAESFCCNATNPGLDVGYGEHDEPVQVQVDVFWNITKNQEIPSILPMIAHGYGVVVGSAEKTKKSVLRSAATSSD